jgi:hypothetical protein
MIVPQLVMKFQKQKIHCRVHESPPPVHIQIEMNPGHFFTLNFTEQFLLTWREASIYFMA